MARLLVVHHSPTPTVQRLTDAVLAGSRDEEIEGVEVVVRPALAAHADDVLAADGVLLGTTANFGFCRLAAVSRRSTSSRSREICSRSRPSSTTAAGACLVSHGTRGDHPLTVVVLGAGSSDSRYVDTRNLFRWAWKQLSQ